MKLRQFNKFAIRAFWALLTLWVVSNIAVVCFAYLKENLSWSLDKDNDLFEKTCRSCHLYRQVKEYAKSPGEWRKTVERMLSKGTIGIDEDQKERIKELLIRKRSTTGQYLFDARCSRCHAEAMVEPFIDLDMDALALLVKQHVRNHNYAVQDWEGDMIVGELARLKQQRTGKKGKSTAKEQFIFQRSCGVCHTPRFLYRRMCQGKRTEDEWEKMVQRMQEKVPDLISEDIVPILATHSHAICRDGSPAP